MPEYLAPGVYVEETSFRAKSIEGVGTSTTAFAGPAARGPIASINKDAAGNAPAPPELLTSFSDFVRLYGGVEELKLGDKTVPNYLALAVLNYFNEGGARLYVARCANDAKAGTLKLGTDGAQDKRVIFTARTPGRGKIRIVVSESSTLLSTASRKSAPKDTLARVLRDETVKVNNADKQLKAGLYHKVDAAENADWVQADQGNTKLDIEALEASKQQLEAVSLTLNLQAPDGSTNTYEGISLVPENDRALDKVLLERPARRADQLAALVSAKVENKPTPRELHGLLFGSASSKPVEKVLELGSGDDGKEPTVGDTTTAGTYAAAFEQLRGLEDVSIVAAPGHSALSVGEAIAKAMISHAEMPRAYRIAVLDTPPKFLPSEAREYKSRLDSTRAALYYPWVTISNPLARAGRDDISPEVCVPPSGLICGIYARNDVEKSVSKAPANEVVRSALRFESDVNFAQNQMLNPLGVNCLRFFPGRGFRVWGARTASSDPEWKYVNVRRYFNYLEASIDRGTQWAVFENNGERLWANIRETVEAFLYNEWVSGNLLGGSTKEAFFVRCDRTTMTQNDLDNGRLICLVGVAVLKPAEFVIFRIGQKTADERS